MPRFDSENGEEGTLATKSSTTSLAFALPQALRLGVDIIQGLDAENHYSGALVKLSGAVMQQYYLTQDRTAVQSALLVDELRTCMHFSNITSPTAGPQSLSSRPVSGLG